MIRSAAMIAAAAIFAVTPIAYGVTPVIHLRVTCETAPTVVMLSDVADIQAPFYVQHELRKIDLIDMGDATERRITRQQLSLRLQLAGYTADKFRITGADECIVTTKEPKELNERIEQLLRAQYAQVFDVDPDEIKVRLLSHLAPPSNDTLTKLSAASRLTAKLGLCECYVQMHSLRHDMRRTQLVKHQVEMLGRVPVVIEPLYRGDVIRASHIAWEKHYVNKTPLTEDQVFDQTVSRDYKVGERLDRNDLRDQRDIRLVESGAKVTAVMKVGSTTFKLYNARAMNAGARGQQIQVKNAERTKILTAEVVGLNEVRVVLPGERRPTTPLRNDYGYSEDDRWDRSTGLKRPISIERPAAPPLLKVQSASFNERPRRSESDDRLGDAETARYGERPASRRDSSQAAVKDDRPMRGLYRTPSTRHTDTGSNSLTVRGERPSNGAGQLPDDRPVYRASEQRYASDARGVIDDRDGERSLRVEPTSESRRPVFTTRLMQRLRSGRPYEETR